MLAGKGVIIMKLQIRHKVILVIVLCSVVSGLLLGGSMLYGIAGIRQKAMETAQLLGNEAADGSSTALDEQASQDLILLSQEKAKHIETKLENLAASVNVMSAEMTRISSNPGDYPLRMPQPPRRENAGEVVPQLQYSASVQDPGNAALQQEIGNAGNSQDFLIQLNNSSPVAASCYVASKNGFIIMADTISDRKFVSTDSDIPKHYEAFSRPWYQKAEAEKKLIFTDIVEDINGGGLCIICAAPYWNGAEFAGVVGMGAYLTEIEQIVLETKIGSTGFGFILNDKGRVVASPQKTGELAVDPVGKQDLRQVGESSLAEAARQMTDGGKGVLPVVLDGKKYYLAYAPLPKVGWSFATVIEEDEVLNAAVQNREEILQGTGRKIADVDSYIRNMIGLLVLAAVILLAVVAFVGWKLAEHLSRPIHELTDGVREISEGSLGRQLEISTGDEIEMLARAFNSMSANLRNYMENLTKVTADKERIATELNVATNIQTSMLPGIFPPFPEREEFDIYATMHAAKEVGGDFYDFYMLDDHHLVITIADVSGKGVPAALFMVIAKTVMKNFVLMMKDSDDFAAAIKCTNMQLCENNDQMMFVTAFIGVLDLQTGTFTYVNAGHNPPLVYHACEDKYDFLPMERNCVLGIREDMDFVQQTIELRPEDLIFLYTDGVTEAMSMAGELYSERRLQECLNHADRSLPVEELLRYVRTALDEHVKEAPQSDDITMLTVKFRKYQQHDGAGVPKDSDDKGLSRE